MALLPPTGSAQSHTLRTYWLLDSFWTQCDCCYRLGAAGPTLAEIRPSSDRCASCCGCAGVEPPNPMARLDNNDMPVMQTNYVNRYGSSRISFFYLSFSEKGSCTLSMRNISFHCGLHNSKNLILVLVSRRLVPPPEVADRRKPNWAVAEMPGHGRSLGKEMELHLYLCVWGPFFRRMAQRVVSRLRLRPTMQRETSATPGHRLPTPSPYKTITIITRTTWSIFFTQPARRCTLPPTSVG